MTKQTEVVLGEAFAAPPSRLAHEAVVTEDGPYPLAELGAVATRWGSDVVLAARATRVPQAAVTAAACVAISSSITRDQGSSHRLPAAGRVRRRV